jgi:protein-tyrosine kinase
MPPRYPIRRVRPSRWLPAPTGRVVPLFPLKRREMLSLYDTLQGCLVRTDSKVLQFIGPRGGEGVSTIAHAFAHVSATLGDRQVLLLDGNRPPSGDRGWASQPTSSLASAAHMGDPFDLALSPTGHPRLFRVALSLDPAHPMADELHVIEGAWPQLRERFDLIVIDSPPALPTPEGITLAMRADAVVLVVEAERTRASLAREAQSRLADAKVQLVGVILNRRRHHIPQWLYRLL